MKPAEVSTPSDREVLVKRSFDAPVNLVWQAYTDPALMRRWLTAMPGWSMPVCEMATDVGGSMGGEPSIITVTFNETNGITNVATSIKYASQADRDAAFSTGMTDGMEMSYKQLDAVLAG